MFPLRCRGVNFLTRIFSFLVSTFWRSELLVPRHFVASIFWRCNIFQLRNKNLTFLYETRAIFSYEIFCRSFFHMRLTCTTVLTSLIKCTQTIFRKAPFHPFTLQFLHVHIHTPSYPDTLHFHLKQ